MTALALAGILAALPLAGCARAEGSGGIAVAGDTRVDLVTVAAPRLTAPTPDVAVGIAKPMTVGAMSAAAKAKAAAAAAGARGPVPAGVLTTVTVKPGDTVRKGQVIAQFDTTLLDLGVLNARAADRRNAAMAGALAQQASDLRDQRVDMRAKGYAALAKGTAALANGISKMEQAIQLEDAVAQLRAARPKVQAGLAQASAILKQLKQVAASPNPPADIQKKIAAAEAGVAAAKGALARIDGTLAKLEPALAAAIKAGLPPTPAAIRALIAKTQAQGAAQISKGRSQLRSGLGKMSDGIDQLNGASNKVGAAQGVQSAAMRSASAALAQATLRAPCDGVVVSAMHAGEVAMVGGPVVVIRPAGDTLVDTYLTRDQLAGTRVGTSADVNLDSVQGVLKGSVQAISADEQFPPSNYPTKIVHLSRVVRVTVSVPDTLPLGVPADVVIRP